MAYIHTMDVDYRLVRLFALDRPASTPAALWAKAQVVDALRSTSARERMQSMLNMDCWKLLPLRGHDDITIDGVTSPATEWVTVPLAAFGVTYPTSAPEFLFGETVVNEEGTLVALYLHTAETHPYKGGVARRFKEVTGWLVTDEEDR